MGAKRICAKSDKMYTRRKIGPDFKLNFGPIVDAKCTLAPVTLFWFVVPFLFFSHRKLCLDKKIGVVAFAVLK